MDYYQQRAAGRDRDAAKPGSHRIPLGPAVILLAAALILDILSVFEVPIADILGIPFSIGLFVYLNSKGLGQAQALTKRVVTWLAGFVIEFIPGADFLPFYLIGMAILILISSSETAVKVASRVPSSASVKKLSTNWTRIERGKKALAKNKLFGAAAQKYEEHAQQLQARLPGPLRSLPARARVRPGQQAAPPAAGDIPAPRPVAGGGRGTAPAPAAPQPAPDAAPDLGGPGNVLPFPGVYEGVERELLPGLEDIEDIDVTGERAVKERPLKRAA